MKAILCSSGAEQDSYIVLLGFVYRRSSMPVGNPEIGDEGDANPHIYHMIASGTLTIIDQWECPMCAHPRVDQHVVEIYRHDWGFTFQVMFGHPGAMGEPSGCYYSHPVYRVPPRGQYVRDILRQRWGTMTPALRMHRRRHHRHHHRPHRRHRVWQFRSSKTIRLSMPIRLTMGCDRGNDYRQSRPS